MTLLWFPTAPGSVFLSDRTAGTDGLSSRPLLDASSCENADMRSLFACQQSGINEPAVVGLAAQTITTNSTSESLCCLSHSHLRTGWFSFSSPNRPRPSPFCPVDDNVTRYFHSRGPILPLPTGHFSNADLWVPFPGYCNALTKFAEEGDGGFGAGDQCRLLLRAQIVVICAEMSRK